jgi:hypothetical protein
LGTKAIVHTREEAKTSGLFGSEVSADASDRIGDLVVIAQGNLILIEAERENQESAMVGHHGGDTDTESYVPLLTTVVN